MNLQKWGQAAGKRQVSSLAWKQNGNLKAGNWSWEA
jgi:hypothetical protein